MFRKTVLNVSVVFLALLIAFGCGGSQSSSGKKKKPVAVPGGTVSPTLGVGFDAYYDPATDSIVPGYKILTVAFTNNSMNIIQLNPMRDQWYIVDRRGKKNEAIINLRREDPDVWALLPKKLKVLLEYPLLISIGATETLDLLFREKVNLGEFKEVIFKDFGAGQEYRIIPREN